MCGFSFLQFEPFFCPPLARFQIHTNPSQLALTLEGDDIGELDKAMQHVAYLNSRQFPTPGIRRLRITSTVKYVLIFNSGEETVYV